MELFLISGFIHEQTRPDRDEYVTIHWNNIAKGRERNFKKYEAAEINTVDAPYDFKSIMHYGKKYFSSNGLETITPIDGVEKNSIGDKHAGFTVEDLKKLNKFYTCPGCTFCSIKMILTFLGCWVEIHQDRNSAISFFD
jgi:meprin B